MKHRIDPELRDILEVIPKLDLSKLQETREQIKQMGEAMHVPYEDSIEVIDLAIDSYETNYQVPIRLYKPKGATENVPGLIWIHSGGFVLGNLDWENNICQRIVRDVGCTVLSVDYRLAPEFPYPTPLEDCYSALKWFAENAEEYGVDANTIGVAGASAGGGLTAGLALLARDRKGPNIVFQMPLYPMINDRNNTPSNIEIQENLVWNHELNEGAWNMYLAGENGKENVPIYAAPARATDLTNLPPAYIAIGQLDPFRDETLTYVTKLCQAGVDVEFHLYPGAFHGFENVAPNADVSIRTTTEYVQAVKRGLFKNKRVATTLGE